MLFIHFDSNVNPRTYSLVSIADLEVSNNLTPYFGNIYSYHLIGTKILVIHVSV